MTGVSAGSRLEQLYRLQARLTLEIAAERRRLILDTPPDPAADTDTILDELGVNHASVRAWATAAGYTPGTRGRISNAILRLYIAEQYRLTRRP